MNVYREEFIKEKMPVIQKQLGITNPMAVPKLSRIVMSMGVKDAATDGKRVEQLVPFFTQIAGQKPKITQAKKSIATFKLREGQKIGLVATMRGDRMYDFFKKLVTVILPRLRDFRGVSKKHFDGHGNYSLGFSEYTVFPEIDPGKVDKIQGLEVTIVTTAKDNKEGELLLEALGMPFQK